MPSIRVEQALEQLSEDGTLTGDLDDAAGGALLQWAEQQIVGADTEKDEAAFAAQVAAIRSAVRSAARVGSRSLDPVAPDTVVAQAAALLNRSLAHSPARSPVAAPHVGVPPRAGSVAPTANTFETNVPADQSAAHTGSADPAAHDAAPGTRSTPTERRSTWETVRRRIRRWMHRKV